MTKDELKKQIANTAIGLGFDICRFTDANLPAQVSRNLEQAIREGHHGQMHWMAETLLRRRQPRGLWREARSAILLGMNYGPDSDPLQTLGMREKATISVYARNRDYHDIIKGRLKQIAQKIASASGEQVKVFVDTAPLMEKPLAQQAGVGWQGKHTNLVSRQFGSWLFLGAILTTALFEQDNPEIDHCGSCRACLDICPTDAFPAPYRLDARRCISYLTIEHKGPVPRHLRVAMGNRIFGCDDCLAVCPWNKFAARASETKLVARADLAMPQLADLVRLDDAAFRQMFAGSPVKRIGRVRFIRNVLIAIGNSGNRDLAKSASAMLDEADPVLRGAAVWALGRLVDTNSFAALRRLHIERESDSDVIDEWNVQQGERAV